MDVSVFQKRFLTLLRRFNKEILVAGPVPLSIENFEAPLQTSNALRDQAVILFVYYRNQVP
jgi:hypothetical protein